MTTPRRSPAPAVRPRHRRGGPGASRRAAAVLLLVVAAGTGCSAPDPAGAPASAADPAPSGPAPSGPAPSVSSPAPPPDTGPSTPVPDPPPPAAPGVTAADRAAGVRTLEVAQSGSGETETVPGSSAAPPAGRVRTLRVEIERGLDVDGATFADFVLTTLNDPRGWGGDGSVGFARTDGDAELRLVLASPDTARRMCRPLETYGKLSCRIGGTVVLTNYRWTLGVEDYGDDRTGYRQYLVNHEVGHALGHSHVPCPGAGRPAPTMMQQTKGLDGCLPNPWPNP